MLNTHLTYITTHGRKFFSIYSMFNLVGSPKAFANELGGNVVD